MKSFDLIIQRTKDGLEEEYISASLNSANLNSEIEETLKDERRIATKLSNQSDVYSVQITKNFRVYSLIVTNIIDNHKRAGFYAIRLYSPKKYPLANFEVILQQINKKYQEYENNGTTKNNQDYTSLLSYNLPLEVKQQDFINAKTNEEAFYLFDANSPQLSSVFNHKTTGLFNKVYAFNKENVVSVEIIKSLGLISYEETQNTLKEVLINNNHFILKELKINSIPIEFNPNESELTLIVKREDVIQYNTTDNLTFKQATDVIINVARKYTAPPVPPRPKAPKKTFLQENGIYLGILLLTVMIAGGAWYIFEGKNKQEDDVLNTETVQTIPTDTITSIVFINDGSLIDSIYKTTYPKLDKYLFKLDNKKWSYKNTEVQKIYVAFYINNLDEIIRKNSLEINEDKKQEFLKNLKEISGQEVLKKEDSENNSVKIKKPVEVIKKETSMPASPSEEKQNPTTKKIKVKDEMKVDGDSKI